MPVSGCDTAVGAVERPARTLATQSTLSEMKMRTKFALLGLAITCMPAIAQYKCVLTNGNVSFQQTPCAASDRSEKMRIQSQPLSGATERSIETAQNITSILKLELYEENTDADPAKDSVKVFVVFGDSSGGKVRTPDGAVFPFQATIFESVDDQQGRQIASTSGELKSERGFTHFLLKLASVKTKTRLLAHVKVTMQSGKTFEGKRSDTFDPNRH